MDYDILITNAMLLTDAGQKEVLPRGFLGIQGRKIAVIGRMADLPTNLKAGRIIDAAGGLVMPGLINGHCHAAMTLFRGLADDLPLMTWLNEHIFPAEASHVSREMVYWCSKLAAAEMVLSGTTTVADGYFFEEEAARAFREIGLRAVAAQGIIDFPAPGVPDPAENIKAAEQYIDNLPSDDLVRPALFCHSPYTCSPVTLQAAKRLATERHIKFFIHVAETSAEVETHRRQHGLSPIQHLRQLNLLDENTVCVHCVWPSAAEIALLADTGCGVITCPESNMKLASGIAPVPKMLAAGALLGIGTDGCASNNDLDMLQEIDSLAKIHKAVNLDPTIIPARTALKMATSSGAMVLGLDEVGTLRVGMQADIIILDLNQPHLTPFYTPDLLVYAARGSDVKTSIIAGQLVMENRKLLNIDLAETMAAVQKMREAVNPSLEM